MRERAYELVELLGNPDRIRAERLKARELKALYSGYGGGSVPAPPPKPSSGDGSSRDFRSSNSPRHWDEAHRATRSVGARGGGGGGNFGRDDIGDEWAAAYERSPSPSPVWRQSGHDRTQSVGSDTIDFDTGREEYSGRLSRYQEKEKAEAAALAAGSRARR